MEKEIIEEEEPTNKPTKNSEYLDTTPYKGVRDFYPEEMFVENYITDIMRETVESFGYLEYDASVLEPSELYERAKSGDEIVNEQTYSFVDRGERRVTLRPEMTPTLARMVSARRSMLPLPLRWYSIPNLFRYERPQRGRLREHRQLNVDILGVTGISAETEIINVAFSLMRGFGIKDSDFEIRINSRKIINYILGNYLGLSNEICRATIKIIDRKDKISPEEFEVSLRAVITEEDRLRKLLNILNSKNFESLTRLLPKNTELDDTLAEVKTLMLRLENLCIRNVVFSQTLMRGFEYYTGIVFEIFDLNPKNRRALFGGGRYDNLLQIFGAEKIPAVGFGMGNVTLRDVLETYKLLPSYSLPVSLSICLTEEKFADFAETLAKELREKKIIVTIDYSGKKLKDQLRSASKQNVPFVVCIGEDEVETDRFRVKNMKEKTETALERDRIADFISLNQKI